MLRFNSNYQNPLVPPTPISIIETINNAPSTLLPLPQGARQVFNLNGKYTLDSTNGGGNTSFQLPEVDALANAVGVSKLFAVISVLVTIGGSIYNYLTFPNNPYPGIGSAALAYPYTGDFATDSGNVFSQGGSFEASPTEYDQPIINTTSTGWLSAIIPMLGVSGVLTGSCALFGSSTVTTQSGATFEIGSIVNYNYAIYALPASNLLTDNGLGNIFRQLQTANTALDTLNTNLTADINNNGLVPTQQFFQIATSTTTAQSFTLDGALTPALAYIANISSSYTALPVQISLNNTSSSSISYTFTATYYQTTLTFTGSAPPGLSVIATIPSVLGGYSIYYVSGSLSQSIALTLDTTANNTYLVAELLGIR